MPIFLLPKVTAGTVIITKDVDVESYQFAYNTLPPGLVNAPIFVNEGLCDQVAITIPYAGSIIACVLRSDKPVTQGTITVRPTVNGVVLPSALLDAQLTIIAPTYDYKKVATGTFNFLIANTLGVVVTTTGNLLPINTIITVDLYAKLTVP